LKISRVPFLIAFILASILEHNYHLAMRFNSGSATLAFFSGTTNLVLIAFFAVSMLMFFIPSGAILDRFM